MATLAMVEYEIASKNKQDKEANIANIKKGELSKSITLQVADERKRVSGKAQTPDQLLPHVNDMRRKTGLKELKDSKQIRRHLNQ